MVSSMSDDRALKILVATYSRTGNTNQVANALARRCNADLEELRDVRDRRGVMGYLRSAKEAIRHVLVPIVQPTRNWRDYDLVVLGTPVWAGRVSSPMRTYLSHQVALGEPTTATRVAFFCTMGGRGAENVFAELEQLMGVKPVATLALTDGQVARRQYDIAVAEFANKLLANNAATFTPKSARKSLLSMHYPIEHKVQ
jgi:flavodoxin